MSLTSSQLFADLPQAKAAGNGSGKNGTGAEDKAVRKGTPLPWIAAAAIVAAAVVFVVISKKKKSRPGENNADKENAGEKPPAKEE